MPTAVYVSARVWQSLPPLSGVNREAVITVAWDIAWYQYRVTFDSIQPVRLAERGDELDGLEASFQRWNASLDEDGRVVPEFARAELPADDVPTISGQ